MTPTLWLLVLAVVVGALIYAVRRYNRYAHAGRTYELGAVSTRWLSELRRDEPWTRS